LPRDDGKGAGPYRQHNHRHQVGRGADHPARPVARPPTRAAGAMTMQRILIIAGAVAAVVILILANALYIVPVDKQAIVLRLGEAQYTVNATQPGMAEAGVPMANAPAGLHFKVPLLEDVRFYEKRNQGFELDAAEVIANDQQRLFVDAIARWRIRDPLQYLR